MAAPILAGSFFLAEEKRYSRYSSLVLRFELVVWQVESCNDVDCQDKIELV
jgi:hypothetical protein